MGLHFWVADTNPAIAMALLGFRRQRNRDDCPQRRGALGRRPPCCGGIRYRQQLLLTSSPP